VAEAVHASILLELDSPPESFIRQKGEVYFELGCLDGKLRVLGFRVYLT